MDIVLSKSDLNQALSVTQNIVERKTTMPILANVLLSATDGKLRVSATDLEITAVATVNAAVKAPGSTTVNAKVLADIVRELPDGEVHLKVTEGERLEINALTSQLRVIGVSAEEFPSLPGMGFQLNSRVKAGQLLEMIEKTIYAVSTDETRFNLNGVCFEVESSGKGKKAGANLRLVATDGHRLAMVTRPIEGLELKDSVIVPRKGLTEIRKLLAAVEGELDVGLSISEGFFVLETDSVLQKGSAKVSMRLIDGEFPDYNQVIPNQKGVMAMVSSFALSQALRRVALMVTGLIWGIAGGASAEPTEDDKDGGRP